MRKRLISLMAALSLVLVLLPGTALSAPFDDVRMDQWFYSDVEAAYRRGLLNGTSKETFDPEENLTYAEAVKLAACMRQQYLYGFVTIGNGDPWYEPYVDYCKEQGIITKDYPWTEPATRAGYLEVFANALPERAMTEKNLVVEDSIPDVPMSHPQANAIYKMYRVGILQGNDERHSCEPDANITRGEVAAIVNRMMDPNQRISVTMDRAAMMVSLNEKRLSIAEGETASVIAEVERGIAPYTYTWQLNGKRMDAETRKLMLGEELKAGIYQLQCQVTDADGQAVSSEIIAVEVIAAASEGGFVVSKQPKTTNVGYQEELELSVAVSGGKVPYSYQWQAKALTASNWGNLTGGLKDTLALKARGSSQYRCVITDADGNSIVTETATLKVVH